MQPEAYRRMHGQTFVQQHRHFTLRIEKGGSLEESFETGLRQPNSLSVSFSKEP
jgi:hypothetical protein